MYRILLIDDDPSVLRGLETIVTDYFPDRLEATAVRDGFGAVRLLQKTFFHIIVSDNKMPGLDGLTLLRILKDNQISSHVIIVSGFDDYTYVRRAMKLGIHDYLLKPINVKEFVGLLDGLLPVLRQRESILPPDIPNTEEKAQEEERSYFDLPLSACPYTAGELAVAFSGLRETLLSMDKEAAMAELEKIFTHISPETVTKEEFQEMFSNFVYASMESNPLMIGIVSKYKLTGYDMISRIRNLPGLGQLFETSKEILALYISELGEVKKSNDEYVVKKTKKYIENHFQEEITLASLAALFKLHPNYFSALFKAHAGITVRDYIGKVRIENAMRLLQEPDSKILEVALAVGYQDAAHFTRAFKRQTALTPSLYKQTAVRRPE